MIHLPRRSIRYVPLAVLAAAALLVPAAPASADAPVVDLNCTTTVTTVINPGVSLDEHEFAVSSQGFTGTSDCTGTINGEPVTGPGVFAINDVAFGNCVAATGHGTFVLKIPTASGTQTVAGHYTITFTAATGIITNTGDLTGHSVVTSAVGDCVTTPLSQTTEVLTEHVT
jgi:hypothetical protein